MAAGIAVVISVLLARRSQTWWAFTGAKILCDHGDVLLSVRPNCVGAGSEIVARPEGPRYGPAHRSACMRCS